jgi:hypothetical protein
MRESISFEESCSRSCALILTIAVDLPPSGLDGYACENCLAYVVEQLKSDAATEGERCGYCGSDSVYVGARGVPICVSCAKRALQTSRAWYERRGNQA